MAAVPEFLMTVDTYPTPYMQSVLASASSGHQSHSSGGGQLLQIRCGEADPALPRLLHMVAGHALASCQASQSKRTWLRRRHFGKDGIAEAGVVLFQPDSVKVERYRYRGAKIATPGNAEMLEAERAAFRQVHDERVDLERLQLALFG
jgi:hypothetical protein